MVDTLRSCGYRDCRGRADDRSLARAAAGMTSVPCLVSVIIPARWVPLLARNTIATPTVVTPRRALVEAGGFDNLFASSRRSRYVDPVGDTRPR
jgi:hypothetical protein